MYSVFKNFVLVVLVILQFVSPLVHAHTGNNLQHSGIHVPGLEAYLSKQDAPILVNVKLTWQSSEGLVVLVDAGIKNLQDMSEPTAESQLYFAINRIVPAHMPVMQDQNFSPQRRTLTPPCNAFLPQSPRAPPLATII